MKRGGRIKSSGPPKRRKPVNRRNAKRRAANSIRNYGDRVTGQGALARSLPCAVKSCRARPTVAAHFPTKATTGREKDILPLCPRCHDLQGSMGDLTFQRTFNIDMAAECARLADMMAAGWKPGSEGNEDE